MTDEERMKVVKAYLASGNDSAVIFTVPWLIKQVEELKDYLDVVIESNREWVFKLKASNGVLREALEKITTISPHYSCRDGQGLIATNAIAEKALATTPQDASERIKKLEAVVETGKTVAADNLDPQCKSLPHLELCKCEDCKVNMEHFQQFIDALNALKED